MKPESISRTASYNVKYANSFFRPGELLTSTAGFITRRVKNIRQFGSLNKPYTYTMHQTFIRKPFYTSGESDFPRCTAKHFNKIFRRQRTVLVLALCLADRTAGHAFFHMKPTRKGQDRNTGNNTHEILMEYEIIIKTAST